MYNSHLKRFFQLTFNYRFFKRIKKFCNALATHCHQFSFYISHSDTSRWWKYYDTNKGCLGQPLPWPLKQLLKIRKKQTYLLWNIIHGYVHWHRYEIVEFTLFFSLLSYGSGSQFLFLDSSFSKYKIVHKNNLEFHFKFKLNE